jgi:cysteine synthase
MSRINNNIMQTIGNTPLVRLNRTAKKHGALADVVSTERRKLLKILGAKLVLAEGAVPV